MSYPRPSALALLSVAALFVFAPAASPQTLPMTPGDSPQQSAGPAPGGVQMNVSAPQAEVLQSERIGTSGPSVTQPPLEGPIDPDTYICGRGYVFDLNFWGAQNF